MEDIIQKAKEYSLKKHDLPSDCQRYGNEPYSVHLKSVVDNIEKYLYLLDTNYHDDVVASGWAHDLIEDTDTSIFMVAPH